jgi:hypothetical protein
MKGRSLLRSVAGFAAASGLLVAMTAKVSAAASETSLGTTSAGPSERALRTSRGPLGCSDPEPPQNGWRTYCWERHREYVGLYLFCVQCR